MRRLTPEEKQRLLLTRKKAIEVMRRLNRKRKSVINGIRQGIKKESKAFKKSIQIKFN